MSQAAVVGELNAKPKRFCKCSQRLKQQEKPSRINNNLGAIKSEFYHPDKSPELLGWENPRHCDFENRDW